MSKLAPSRKPETATCPVCESPMTLARVTPRLAGMEELHTFECKGCGVVLTQVANDSLNAGPYRGLLP